jgi:anti-sigma-K factor RskA
MSTEPELDEIAMLLPFYVNGTLGPVQRAQVDAAMATNPTLQAELGDIRTLQGLVHQGAKQIEAQLQPTSTARLEKLLDQIEADAPRVNTRHTAPPRAPERQNFWSSLFSFRWQPAFAIAAAALILVQSGTIGYLASRDTPSSYGTLSGSGTDIRKVTLFLQIEMDAKWADVTDMLNREGLTIVSGPVDGSIGVAPVNALTPAQIKALLIRLSASPVVFFAGPAA